jgi:hypothetical protein
LPIFFHLVIYEHNIKKRIGARSYFVELTGRIAIRASYVVPNGISELLLKIERDTLGGYLFMVSAMNIAKCVWPLHKLAMRTLSCENQLLHDFGNHLQELA